MKTKEQKKQEAKERQEKYNQLTPRQKLEYLDKKYGKDQGATKERIKLLELIKYNDADKVVLPKKKVKSKKGQNTLREKKKARKKDRNKQ